MGRENKSHFTCDACDKKSTFALYENDDFNCIPHDWNKIEVKTTLNKTDGARAIDMSLLICCDCNSRLSRGEAKGILKTFFDYARGFNEKSKIS